MDFINAFPGARVFVGTRITGDPDEHGGVFVVLFKNDHSGPKARIASDIVCITSVFEEALPQFNRWLWENYKKGNESQLNYVQRDDDDKVVLIDSYYGHDWHKL